MKEKDKKRKDKFWIVFIVVVIAAVLLRLFVVEFVNISGESMSPTLENGQLIIINKVDYTPSRGDIVVFDSPNGLELVKRIIGLPGETIEIADGIVYINGEKTDDDYQFPTSESLPETTIPKGTIYVLGDNRNHSSDSRVFGAIELDEIRGKMMLTIY